MDFIELHNFDHLALEIFTFAEKNLKKFKELFNIIEIFHQYPWKKWFKEETYTLKSWFYPSFGAVIPKIEEEYSKIVNIYKIFHYYNTLWDIVQITAKINLPF